MNYRMILYILGWVFNILSASLLLPTAVGLIYGEAEWSAYALTALLSLFLGVMLTLKKPRKTVFFAKEGYVIVALSWTVMSVVGAVPFVISKDIPNFVNALFESASGFSTTGASILTDVEACSHATIFWRSFMHWLGGMGVLVFLLAILPLVGGHNMELMKAESPGPQVGKFVPKVRRTAVILYGIYSVMTFAEFVALKLSGMPLFDSVTIAVGTAGTGGFSVTNAGVAGYTSLQQSIITVFMILFSVNFGIYYLVLMRKFRQILKNEEFRWFVIVIVFSVLCITFNITNTVYGGNFREALHHSAFSVATVVSTSGFATADFNTWPQVSKFILFVLMFMGASAGSTGGGMKVSRFIILVKSAVREIESIIHPRSVKVVRLDNKRVEDEVLRRTHAYFLTCLIVYVVSVFIISFDNFDMVTSVTAVAATMNNIGPGLGKVGPMGNYSEFSALSKLVLTFNMIAGRLEMFPMIVLLSPSTWKGSLGVVKRKTASIKRKIIGIKA